MLQLSNVSVGRSSSTAGTRAGDTRASSSIADSSSALLARLRYHSVFGAGNPEPAYRQGRVRHRKQGASRGCALLGATGCGRCGISDR